MDEIERRLATTELLLEMVISVLGADQVDELRRRLREVEGLCDDSLAVVAQARHMADLGEQMTAQPSTAAAKAAAELDRVLRGRSDGSR